MGTLSHESAIGNSVSGVALVHSLPAGNSDPFREYRCYPFVFMSIVGFSPTLASSPGILAASVQVVSHQVRPLLTPFRYDRILLALWTGWRPSGNTGANSTPCEVSVRKGGIIWSFLLPALAGTFSSCQGKSLPSIATSSGQVRLPKGGVARRRTSEPPSLP